MSQSGRCLRSSPQALFLSDFLEFELKTCEPQPSRDADMCGTQPSGTNPPFPSGRDVLRFRRARLYCVCDFCTSLAFGLQPIVQVVSIRSAMTEKYLVSAGRDLRLWHLTGSRHVGYFEWSVGVCGNHRVSFSGSVLRQSGSVFSRTGRADKYVATNKSLLRLSYHRPWDFVKS